MAQMNQLSDIFFSLANVLSFARIAHLLPANEQLGPLLVSFGRMLHDFTRSDLALKTAITMLTKVPYL